MPFVKLDTGILDSTLWFGRSKRDMFLTALLMAEPREIPDTPQLLVDSLEDSGWVVPAGWYGFVEASGPGIAARAQVPWDEAKDALRSLGEPEPESRSQEFDGRRLVRVNGGYVVLNYMKYRERDYTSAERQARYRARKAEQASRRDGVTSRRDVALPSRNITHSRSRVQSTEAEAEAKTEESPSLRSGGRGATTALTKAVDDGFEAFWRVYPKKVGKGAARASWAKLKPSGDIVQAVERQKRSKQWLREGGRYIPNPTTWLNQQRWEDSPDPEVPQLSDQTIRIMSGGKEFLGDDHD